LVVTKWFCIMVSRMHAPWSKVLIRLSWCVKNRTQEMHKMPYWKMACDLMVYWYWWRRSFLIQGSIENWRMFLDLNHQYQGQVSWNWKQMLANQQPMWYNKKATKPNQKLTIPPPDQGPQISLILSMVIPSNDF